MFLGCPFRMILRLAGGDWNAIFGLIGFIVGILAGVFFLKKGYTLKRSYKMQPVEGVIFPVVEIGILVLLIAAPHLFISQKQTAALAQSMRQLPFP